jgi:hypothetical protein
MKARIVISLMILLIVVCCSPNEKQHRKIDGAWSLVSYLTVSKDTVVGRYIGKDVIGSQIKVWTQEHFVFVGRFIVRDKAVDNYGGGTYTLEGSQYIETIQYHKNHQWVNSQPRMLVEIKGDTLYQTWPVNDNWQVNKYDYTVEKYVKIK